MVGRFQGAMESIRARGNRSILARPGATGCETDQRADEEAGVIFAVAPERPPERAHSTSRCAR